MGINDLSKMAGDACYVFLAINFFWGLYHIVIGYRRVKELSFDNHEEQAEFLDEVSPPLRERRYAAVEELCMDDARRAAATDSPGGRQSRFGPRSTAAGRDRGRAARRDGRPGVSHELDRHGDQERSAAGPVRHGAGHDGGVRPHRHRREGAAVRRSPTKSASRSICTAMGLGDGHSVQLHAGQPARRGFAAFQDALGAGLVRVLELLQECR